MKIKINFLSCISFIFIAAALIAFELPEGWRIAGSKPKSYLMSVEKNAGHDGKNAAMIKSVDKEIDGFGTLMQTCSPDKYSGSRIRMSGYIKSKDVKGYAGLWLRVDQAESKEPLSFDNMSSRPVKGTTDWKKYEIVLDVPVNSSKLAYGALLSGTGQILFDNINFEIVDSTISVTGQINNKKMIQPPSNLDFSK
jgi:hypothetical protein